MRLLGRSVPILITLLVYIIIKAFVIGTGIGVGFLLNWLLPALNLSVAMLIGVIATGISLHFFGRFLGLENSLSTSPADLDLDDEQSVVDIINSLPPPPTRHTGKRKKRKWQID